MELWKCSLLLFRFCTVCDLVLYIFFSFGFDPLCFHYLCSCYWVSETGPFIYIMAIDCIDLWPRYLLVLWIFSQTWLLEAIFHTYHISVTIQTYFYRPWIYPLSKEHRLMNQKFCLSLHTFVSTICDDITSLYILLSWKSQVKDRPRAENMDEKWNDL